MSHCTRIISHCRRIIVVLAATGLTTAAHAHGGHDISALPSGLLHPFGGLDHALAIVTAGAWASVLPSGARVRTVVLFAAMLATGGLLSVFGPGFVAGGPVVLAALLVGGLLLACSPVVPAGLGVAVIGGFALLQGTAHGALMPAGGLAGLVAGSVVLLAIGLVCGSLIHRNGFGRAAAGFAVAGAGLALAA